MSDERDSFSCKLSVANNFSEDHPINLSLLPHSRSPDGDYIAEIFLTAEQGLILATALKQAAKKGGLVALGASETAMEVHMVTIEIDRPEIEEHLRYRAAALEQDREADK